MLKNFAFATVLLVSLGRLHAQPTQVHAKQKVDSLKIKLARAAGKEKARALESLADTYASFAPDSVYPLLNQAEAIYKNANDEVSLIRLYISYARYLKSQDASSSRAFDYLLLAKVLASRYQVPMRERYLMYKALADYHYSFGKDDSTLHYNLQMLRVAKDTSDIILALKRTGLTYNSMGVTIKALDCYLEALKLLQLHPDPLQEASVYNNLGILYEDDGDNEKSEEFYEKAVAIHARLNNPEAKFSLLNNLGILYDHQHRYEESLQTLQQAAALLPVLKKISVDTLARLSLIEVNIANTLTHMGRAAEAIPRFEKAKRYATPLKNNYRLTLIERQLAEAFYKIGRYREGELQALRCIEDAKKFGYTYLIKDAYQDLYDIYGATRQFEKAFKFQSLYLQMEDSLNDKERRSKLGLLEKQYELSRQESEKQLLAKENEVQRAQAKVDKITQISLWFGVGLFVVMAAVAWVAYFRARTKSRLLAAQKAKIEDASKLITQQAAQLEETAKTKLRFFANVSHELRTPVTLLSGMLEMMRTDNTPANKNEKMRIALANSRRLHSLVDEVLDLSRLEEQQITIDRKRKELTPLLNRIVFAFESLLDKKHITLRYHVASIQGLFIDVDEDKFEKTVNNLMSNAVKFSREGGWIQVEAKVLQDQLIIQVSDSGIGIPEKDLPYIFERFYQSSAAIHKNAQGIGIGLSLVKEFMTLHGGNVSVTSKLHEGSTFTLSFPLVAHHESTVLLEDTTNDVPVDIKTDFSIFAKPPVIMVVEDNDEMRFYLKEIFEGGVTLIEANNGLEALKKLETSLPDIIISDVMMPEMDGYQFLARVKNNETWKNIPVMMLTARASEEDLLHGLSFGVDDYIIKPFNTKELRVRVYNILKNQWQRQQWMARPAEKDELIQENQQNKKFLEQVEAFVLQRLQNAQLGIGDLALHVAMSERQLYRYCGTVTGLSPAQLIKEIRLKMAHRMLIEGTVTKISELASRVGFENSAYFSRQFLERFGKRPVDML